MENRCQMNRLAIVGIVLAIFFWSAAPVSAKDWHELGDLDDGQLAEKFKNWLKTCEVLI
jgi:hypothetical protein